MNPLDLVAIALLVVGLVLGFRSGAVPQVLGLVGAGAGAALAILSLPALADPIDSLDPSIRPFVVLGGLLLAVAVGESIGSTVGRRLTRGLGAGVLGTADRIGGAVVGLAQAVLVIWLVGGLLALGPVERLTQAALGSTVIRTLNGWLPPPADLALQLGKLLDATGLPAVFIGFEPVPLAPVDRPSDPTARGIANIALLATVKVSAGACGYISSGTGFSVAEDYVVTNAHVVAGADRRSIRVTDHAGHLHDATAVAFDPGLDIAVLHVPGLGVHTLTFTDHEPARGAVGATLGYPGGGPLVILPAAVTGGYPATGRDIYGEGRVRREILELRAAIDRGDSGGPLVLADGTVGGVVFAEARTDPDVGYALSPTEVWAKVGPLIGRTKAIDTGACIH